MNTHTTKNYTTDGGDRTVIGGVLEFDAVVKAGGTTHYDVFRVDGTTLTLESVDATVTYAGKTYEPVNGVISIFVTTDDVRNPIKLAIGNTGTTDATFKVTFTYPKGTLLNPYELGTLKGGEGKELNVAIEAGNETGVVYTYTATANGVLHIDVIHDTVLLVDVEAYNLTSGVNLTMIEDGEKGNLHVEVAKGDEVRITFMVLPNEKNEYPAMTVEATVCFGEKEDVTVDGPDRTVDYTVTVKDQDGKPVAGLELRAQVEQIWKTVTTDGKGVAKFVLPEGAPSVKLLTIPEGYIAAANTFWFKAGNPTLTITLEKEQVTPPTTPTKPTTPGTPTQPEVTTMDYTVTLMDGNGAPMGGLPVTFYSGDKQVAKQVGDKKGVSRVTLERGTYTVKVGDTLLRYDEKAAVVSVNKANITLVLAADIDTSKTYKLVVTQEDETDRKYTVPYLSEGAAYVTLVPGERNYFMFEPTRDGTFRFSSSNTYAKIGHFGTDMFVYLTNSAEVSGNAFNISVRETELGNVYVIGIDAATNCSAAVLQVTRVGDPAWSIEDEPLVEYTGAAPKPVTAPTGLADLDIKSSTEHQLVFNEKDGYYHLDSANGPVVYVHMDSPYASIVGMLSEFGNMTAYIYNADGTFKAKEQYATLMQQYVNNMDKSQKVYPLTKDLEYMIRNYGNSQNWWNEGEAGYLFEEVSGVNPANAWMFLYCYKK
jgi:hypothetical protein